VAGAAFWPARVRDAVTGSARPGRAATAVALVFCFGAACFGGIDVDAAAMGRRRMATFDGFLGATFGTARCALPLVRAAPVPGVVARASVLVFAARVCAGFAAASLLLVVLLLVVGFRTAVRAAGLAAALAARRLVAALRVAGFPGPTFFAAFFAPALREAAGRARPARPAPDALTAGFRFATGATRRRAAFRLAMTTPLRHPGSDPVLTLTVTRKSRRV
jgi:hypothetical protein